METTINHRSSNQSLADKACRLLAEKIITLQLRPGELLVEKQLAELAGTGRTPVREAIQRLAALGLLQVLPRKGLMVTAPARSELAMMLETRKVLERLMVVKAAERASPDQRQALRTLEAHIGALDNDFAGFLRLDTRLGELLGLASGNPFLLNSLTPLHVHCRRLWHLHRKVVEPARAAYLHAGLAGMVAGGNGAGAIRALDEIIATLEGLVNRMDVLS